jgi:replicative DNA helicase
MPELPTNLDAERFVLGSILLDSTHYPVVAGTLEADDFSIDPNRRIWRRMAEVQSSGATIDRVTVANALMSAGDLEAIGGLSYLVSLDDGLPRLPNVDSYVRIVKDKATLRRIVYASQKLSNRAMGDEDPATILADANRDLLALAEGCTESTLQTPMEIITAAGGMAAYLDRKARRKGTPTGFPLFDLMTGGLQRGKLYILAARPAMGKTALALNIVDYISVGPPTRPGADPHEPQTSIIFSLEMPKDELIDRLICARAEINTQRLAGGHLDELEDLGEMKAAEMAASEISAYNRILIDDAALNGSQDIHAKVRKQLARGPVGLVVVDYLQLMVNCKDSERVAAVSRLSRDMKIIARDCNVPMLVLSQLSRACETRGSAQNPDGYRPQLSDLRESGGIEQDADVVASVCRLEYYLRDQRELQGLADMEILKQRGGPTGRIPLKWHAEFVRFEEDKGRK